MAVVLALTGMTTVQASEVTGTLSSNASSDSQTSGNIGGTVSSNPGTTGNLEGTVSSGNGGSSSGGGGGGGRSGSSSNAPSGAVLGESVINTQAPSFPNAGVEPELSHANQSFWLRIMTLLRNIASF